MCIIDCLNSGYTLDVSEYQLLFNCLLYWKNVTISEQKTIPRVTNSIKVNFFCTTKTASVSAISYACLYQSSSRLAESIPPNLSAQLGLLKLNA